MQYPSKPEDQLNIQRKKINSNVISYDLVANWDELNRELIHGKIDCGVCYTIIFYHQTLEDRAGPLAYQCVFCQSHLICSRCRESLTTCPFCKRDDSLLEPASSIILNEIKKMKFRCLYSMDSKSNHKQCLMDDSMTPRDLFKHYAFDCVAPQRLNRYTLKTRDLNICKYYCSLKTFETKHFSSDP